MTVLENPEEVGDLPPATHFIKGDLLIVPVLDVEEQHNAAIFISA